MFTVSLELSDIALKGETEYDEQEMCPIDPTSISRHGLGVTMTEEEVISVRINKSRGWLMLERERSQCRSGRERSWRRIQIWTKTGIAVQMNIIIFTE